MAARSLGLRVAGASLAHWRYPAAGAATGTASGIGARPGDAAAALDYRRGSPARVAAYGSGVVGGSGTVPGNEGSSEGNAVENAVGSQKGGVFWAYDAS